MLLDLGDLQSYSRQKNITPSAIRDIRERIEALSAELAENAEPLKRMPIASLFLNSKLAGFKQAEERYKRVEDKAVINLTLIETAGPGE
ncbi:MAG: hypothetical protein A2X36_04075 [Elusimicrobia bacterium GWA2_69_24]|nr:MAG: hypothetical protein A2X36_04075 [Elusimicrobia bacterium GWA2_69_24]HBL17865.1 hypothetical protein [Elusimicrobiota bacterium]